MNDNREYLALSRLSNDIVISNSLKIMKELYKLGYYDDETYKKQLLNLHDQCLEIIKNRTV